MLLRRIIRTSAALDELINTTSDSREMLHKTGLIDFAHQFARKLDYLRDNAHRQITMRAFASVDLLPLQRGRLQVRIDNKLRPVEMKNHRCQKKSAQETLESYLEKLLVIQNGIEKLSRICGRVAILDDSINWENYRRLKALSVGHDLPLEFYGEALCYGAEILMPFLPCDPKDHVYMTIYRRAFNLHERRLCFLWTLNYEFRFHVTEEHIHCMRRFQPYTNILVEKRR